MGSVKTKTDKSKGKMVNLYVAIYECESTGNIFLQTYICYRSKDLRKTMPSIKCKCYTCPFQMIFSMLKCILFGLCIIEMFSNTKIKEIKGGY